MQLCTVAIVCAVAGGMNELRKLRILRGICTTVPIVVTATTTTLEPRSECSVRRSTCCLNYEVHTRMSIYRYVSEALH